MIETWIKAIMFHIVFWTALWGYMEVMGE